MQVSVKDDSSLSRELKQALKRTVQCAYLGLIPGLRVQDQLPGMPLKNRVSTLAVSWGYRTPKTAAYVWPMSWFLELTHMVLPV